MSIAKIRITFESESDQPTICEREIQYSGLLEPRGQEFFAQYTFSQVEAESRWENYFLALPSVDRFLRPVKQSFSLEDIASGAYEDRINTRQMWLEIGNTLLRAKRLLAQSIACYEQEVAHSSIKNGEAENLAWRLHLDKIDRIDLAIATLGKVSDLTARLVFERLGASLVCNLDRSKPEWERDVTWANIREGFGDRVKNPHVASLTDTEYYVVQEIFEDFRTTNHGVRLWAYRVRVSHRIAPSVDRPELYTHLENRERTPITDSIGRVKGWTKGFGGLPTIAEYSFTDLYEDAVHTLRHYIWTLERLEAIPRFSVEAAASSISP